MRQLALNILLYIIVLFCCVVCHNDPKPSTWKTEDGYVPDAVSAIKIGEVVLANVYGANIIDEERPFKARLLNGKVWMVEGAFNKSGKGGVAYIKIQKSDGKVLEVMHGK